MSELLARVKKLVTPKRAEEERVSAVTRKVLKRTMLAAGAHPQVTGALLGGSLAKGTWLPGLADIDVFVKISPATDERAFERIGLKVGREVVRGYPYGKKYAQHPYTEATIDGIKVNIVPCYDVKPGEWKSAADRSQYHVQFVLDNFDRAKKLEVRLLKQFLKTVGVYGAEIELEGLSGYVAEVLVYGQGSFEAVVEFFAKLKPVSEDAFLVIKDPVDSNRNLAKAISVESVAKLMLASRAYQRKPSMEFFTAKKRVVRTALMKRAIALRFEHPELSEDTLWGELKRTRKHLTKHMTACGYRFIRTAAISDDKTKSAIILLPETEILSELEERIGPHVSLVIESEAFLKKNYGKSQLIWVGEDGRLRTLQKRRYAVLVDLLDDVVRGDISNLGASREVAAAISKNGRVVRGDRLVREARMEEWLETGLKDIISDTLGTDPS